MEEKERNVFSFGKHEKIKVKKFVFSSKKMEQSFIFKQHDKKNLSNLEKKVLHEQKIKKLVKKMKFFCKRRH